jgi:glycine dehydrogenase
VEDADLKVGGESLRYQGQRGSKSKHNMRTSFAHVLDRIGHLRLRRKQTWEHIMSVDRNTHVTHAASEFDRSSERFSDRHLGPSGDETAKILAALGVATLDALLDETVPETIRIRETLALDTALTEVDALARLRSIAQQNSVRISMIGQGYYGTHTPAVIQRNILENPAWYTAYTPYQPEISQGRLEALLNFQTVVSDLTGMDIASASLLDEATAAAEAVTVARRSAKSKSDRFIVDSNCHPQVIDVVRTRAEPLGIELVVTDKIAEEISNGAFGALFAWPGTNGAIIDHRAAINAVQAGGGLACVVTDLLACVLLTPPGAFGVDVVVGSAQRFGVPFGYGGPHAGFMAVKDAHKRALPGRLVGMSVDTKGRRAARLALQTREQHIRREKATSNICTAQVLLAVMAGMYACYHGPDGLQRIAQHAHQCANRRAAGVTGTPGLTVDNATWFDTITVNAPGRAHAFAAAANAEGINIRMVDADRVAISCDETTTDDHLRAVLRALGVTASLASLRESGVASGLPSFVREGEFLTHPVFHRYRSETEMLRYLRRLADRDLALDRTMIPLGSCTMKLNATTEMIPVTWPEFAQMHPFAPPSQAQGYAQMIRELEAMLIEITGYDSVSLQPNAGSQGEFAGLLAIRAYHRSRGDSHRNACLIPSSAHGTNAASATMCGMQVVVVACDSEGNVDLADLRSKITEHATALSALMITYPSTHGVFEVAIRDICAMVHDAGGQVYLDGANFNALVGVAKPGQFGADVSHLNLHKTFCIPHGGGGPGVGPVCVRSHLAPFLPGHPGLGATATSAINGPLSSSSEPVGALTSAPYGSAGILPIPYLYIAMMGPDGLRTATAMAIANANYIAKRLEGHYPVLYTGANGRVAHECILDIRPITTATGVSVDDVAKRLIDYGFHAPTMSFPVAGTLMVEPTESESLEELDRFCDAMISIRHEIEQVASGVWTVEDNPLANAPHTADDVAIDDWQHAYGRELAAYPLASLRRDKYWPPVSRIDAAFGDRNVVCSCPPLESYT